MRREPAREPTKQERQAADLIIFFIVLGLLGFG
jgi:hypothetical protein